ncbi:hypothetical protein B1H18_19935 [Streptomyces tsukubensis]|uniref:Resolvase/invertase-type recombinase catalytic domain-containing protein n=1 Tax=Streptomyces tsukubensis TaxID=83656 RepID=A0A1V4A6T6_9ACTN|nr:hypothetical protein B1H18_19935 [Streptomyces tsukubensis]
MLPVGIARIRVVLYACQPMHSNAQPLAPLRTFAEARDWTIVAELIDMAPHEVPLTERPLRPRLIEFIDSGQTDGVVTSAWSSTEEKIRR